MTAASDIVIIGGGIMGLCTAYALAEMQAGSITLVERRYLGAGSTGKSGAILRQHYSHETTIRMSRSSLAFYRDFEAATGRSMGFRRTGMAFIGNEQNRLALEGNVTLQRQLGVDTSIVDAPALRKIEPRAHFDDDVIAAVEPEASFVDPGYAILALEGICRERGVRILTGQTVVDVQLDGDRRVRGVVLDEGERIETRRVVNTAGPWAGRLCRRVGVDLPLTAIRPEQAFFRPPIASGPDRLIFGDLLTGLYWKPEPAGWTRVGNLAYGTDAEVPDPDHYDEGVSDAFIQACRTRMTQRLPHYHDAVSWGGCAALYTVTPDAQAMIGAVPGLEGFFLASGFSGHGFKLGPAVGRGLAGLVVGGSTGDLDPEFFAVDRFEKGQHVRTAYEYGILG